MSAAWVAGSVRARLLLDRRLGREGALGVASSPSLEAAAAKLEGGPYARAAGGGADLEAAQRSVADAALLELRLLSGWLPRTALELLRALGAWFELVNVEDRLAYLLGGDLRRPLRLGVLSSAWPAAASAQSPAELRAALASSAWGDPGGDDPETLHWGLRAAWARRVLTHVPEARTWVSGALALAIARERLVAGRPAEALPLPRLAGLGSGWRSAGSLDALRLAVGPRAAWALDGVADTRDLWRAEAAWWTRIEAAAERLVRGPREGRGVAVGATALIALDARRAATALAVAARGGSAGWGEAIDAVL